MGKRKASFASNGLDVEVVYVNSGSLLSQALIAGTFDLSFSQGSEAMVAKLRGADVRIAAVVANRFNHVYLAAPSITSIQATQGQESRGQPLRFRLALPDQPGAQRGRPRSGKRCHDSADRQFRRAHHGDPERRGRRHDHGGGLRAAGPSEKDSTCSPTSPTPRSTIHFYR